MKVDRLECFVHVAETLNFSKSAQALHCSQPSISRVIHLLEQELGFELFERDRNQVALTPAGAVFYPQARQLLHQYQAAVEEARKAHQAMLDIKSRRDRVCGSAAHEGVGKIDTGNAAGAAGYDSSRFYARTKPG